MASVRQIAAMQNVAKTGGNVSQAMRDAGYKEGTVQHPSVLTRSKAWKEKMGKVLSDEILLQKHSELLNSTRLEHMVFPLNITDEEIKELLISVNCVVRKIQHGELATHVWFWARDNKAIKDALDMAYKLRSKYAAEKFEFKQSAELEDLDREEQELDEELRRLVAERKRHQTKKNTNRKRKNKIAEGSKKGNGEVPAVLPEPEVGGVHPNVRTGK